MDPTLAAVLVNLLSQGLWQLGQSAFSAVEELNEDELLQDAFTQVADELAAMVPGQQHSLAVQILDSPETVSIIRALYLHRLSDPGVAPDTARTAFVVNWERRGGGDVDVPPTAVFDGLVAACDAVLEEGVQAGSLTALDVKEGLRHKLLSEQVAAIEARLEALQEAGEPTEHEIAKYEAAIREEIAVRTSEVTPPDFAGAPRVPLGELYVAPDLTVTVDGEEAVVDYLEWLDNVRRNVVLGNPGAGKSTLATKVCNDLAEGYGTGLVAGRDFTPFMVVLREFGADKKVRPLSIARYIAEQLHVKLQLEHKPAIIEYLLFAGRMMIVFDGLDELLETTYRSEIRQDVESFARRYPNCPVVVTSREVGYEAAPLNPRVFSLGVINDFDENQVAEYAYKWFRLEPDLSEEELTRRASDFVRETSRVPDLRSNALMLALMCNLYRGQNYIPRNRPDVYDKCSRMLFEVRDRQRRLVEELPIEEHVEPAMHHLANWIYADAARQNGVTEGQLIEEAGRFLLRYRFDEDEIYQAQHAAKEFIKFCRGRAWVFTDTGTTEDGERLYQFTHRTFLEYFTARHIVATTGDSFRLARDLVARIARGEADVVAQLAFQMQSKASLGSADEMMAEVIDVARDAGPEDQARILQFAARCLEFLVPKSSTTRALVRAIVDRLFAEDLEAAKAAIPAYRQLLFAGTRNHEAIANEIDALVGAALDENSVRAAEIAYVVPRPLPTVLDFAAPTGPPGAYEYWTRVFADLREAHREGLALLRQTEFAVAYAAWGAGEMRIMEIVEHFGLAALFRPRPDGIWRAQRVPASNLADRLIARARRGSEEIDDIAGLLVRTSPPWASVHDFMGAAMRSAQAITGPSPLDGDGLFVATCFVAAYSEYRARHGGVRAALPFLDQQRRRRRFSLIAPTLDLLEHRYRRERGEGNLVVPPEITDERQRDLLAAWAAGSINLLGDEAC